MNYMFNWKMCLITGILCVHTALAQGQRFHVGATRPAASQSNNGHHAGEQTWSLQFTSESIFLPLERSAHSAVYDAGSNRMIVFGGGSSLPFTLRNDVLVMTNANGVDGTFAGTFSTLVANGAAGAPSPRSDHTAVYDPVSNRMIVFGGCTGLHCSGAEVSNEVWVLSNANGLTGTPSWNQSTPAGTPPAPRSDHTAVYDQVHNRMIIFGGVSGVDPTFNFLSDLWVLSNANGLGGTPSWTQLSPAGTLPPGTALHAAVYDTANDIMAIFGGEVSETQATNAVWILSNASGLAGKPVWTNIVPDGSHESPSKRFGHTAIYDPSSNRMTIFGGTADPEFAFPCLNDVWVLTNANGQAGAPLWTKLHPKGILPGVRMFHTAIYDPGQNTMTIFGGTNFQESNYFSAWVLPKANGIF